MLTGRTVRPEKDEGALLRTMTQSKTLPPALRRWRSPAVVVGATALLLGGLVLSNGGYDYDAVCVDDNGTRVADDRCDGSGHGGGGLAHWYYVRAGTTAPAIGQRATGGTTVAPDGERFSVHTGGVDSHGGTVSRGGFGGRVGSVVGG